MPAHKPTDLSPWKNTVLLHNGAAHNLCALMQLAFAATAPEVTVNLDQIGPVVSGEPSDEPAPALFQIQPKNSEINQLPLVLYKHGGRYHVLFGEAEIGRAKTNQQTQVTGKLVSTPTLKKTRIIKIEPEAVAVAVAEVPVNRYDSAAPRRPPRAAPSDSNPYNNGDRPQRTTSGLYRTNRPTGRRYP